MKVRYYAEADIQEWHENTLRLLGELYEDHGITVEIDQIDEQHDPITDFPGEVRTSTPVEVYERDLKHNSALNQSIEPTLQRGSNATVSLRLQSELSRVSLENTLLTSSFLQSVVMAPETGVARDRDKGPPS
jgi:hypothetical protein